MKRLFTLVSFLVVLCLLLPSVLCAQGEDSRMKVGVTGFTNSDKNDTKYVSSITERVLSVIQRTNRFLVIDLTSPEARQEALDQAAQNWNKDWDSDDIIDPAKGLNAVYTITGEIGDIKFIKLTSSNPNGYKSTLPITVKIIETESGSVVNSKYFESATPERQLTPQDALNKALNVFEPLLTDYVLNNFPLELSIARIETEKKGKATEVIIYGGSSFGIEKGAVFEVASIDRSLGGALPKQIGVIKVSEVLNDKFSKASVKKGGEEISRAISNSQEITCTLVK